MSWLNKHTLFFVLLFTIIGALLHFWNLNWGAPYYFHPDERNIASSVIQISFPDHLNPNFFAYGSLPIYTIYFTGIVTNYVQHTQPTASLLQVPFDQAIIISRIYSAFLATLLIPLLYLLGKRLHSPGSGLLASFFALTSVGLTQFSHFGTFELWLTFFSALLLLLCLDLGHKVTVHRLFVTGLVLGILLSVKVTSLALLPLPIIAMLMSIPYRRLWHVKLNLLRAFGKLLLATIFLGCVAGLVYIATNPYSLTDYKAFYGSMEYESKVALGTLPVFYTQEFYQATPVIFQLLRIYPFLLNPIFTIVCIPALLFVLLQTWRHKDKQLVLLLLFFLILFSSQAFLFVKWTRYMLPTLPFIYLMIALSIHQLVRSIRRIPYSYPVVSFVLASICSLYVVAYCLVVLAAPDSRITAKQWTTLHIEGNKPALSESYDLGILPFNEHFGHLTLCNNYDAEINPMPCNGETIDTTLVESNAVILPSQRISKIRFVNPVRYPRGALFYQSLFSGRAGLRKVYETPCSVLCRILYVGNPVFSLEETTNIFDRPIVTIFTR